MELITKKRKIIKSGQALIVTIPMEFVKKSGLKRGDVVGMMYNEVLFVLIPKIPKGEN